MKAAESYFGKQITPESENIEKECFKIAYVIFCIGNIINPGAKHDYTVIDFWQAFTNTDQIGNYNWAAYARANLLKAVEKFNMDMVAAPTSVLLVGCHLILQVQ